MMQRLAHIMRPLVPSPSTFLVIILLASICSSQLIDISVQTQEETRNDLNKTNAMVASGALDEEGDEIHRNLEKIAALVASGDLEEARDEFLKLKEVSIPEIVEKYCPSYIDTMSLLRLTRALPGFKQQCNMLEGLRKKLNSIGMGQTLQQLVVWLRSKILLYETSAGSLSWHSHLSDCLTVFQNTPGYKTTFQQLYLSKVQEHSFSDLNGWHFDHPEIVLVLANVIQSLRRDEIRLDNANNWADFIEQLQRGEDACVALKYLNERMKEYQLLHSHEQFRIAYIVNKLLTDAKLKNVENQFREYCSIVMESVPSVFKKLLSGKTSKCQFINRRYHETLYCTHADMFKDDLGRKIYAWYENGFDVDHVWRIKISNSDARVSFYNDNLKIFLQHTNDINLRGVDGIVPSDYFRVHASDDEFLRIQSADGRYIMAMNYYCDGYEHRRCVDMRTEGDGNIDWEVMCY